jgi:hypothetical protein
MLTVDGLLTAADFSLLLESRQPFQLTSMCFGFRHGRLSFRIISEKREYRNSEGHNLSFL